MTRDLALGHMRAGFKLAQAGDYDGAGGEFRQAVDANPQLAEGWFDLAGALLQAGKVDDALQTFLKALSLAPRWPEAHYQFALALVRAGRRDQALGELRTALDQDPQHAGAKLAPFNGSLATQARISFTTRQSNTDVSLSFRPF